MPSRTLACIECKCSGYRHLLFWGLARCVFVPQKPFCATKRLAPGAFSPRRFGSKVATSKLNTQPLHELPPSPPEMGRPHQSRPEAKGDDEREVKGESPFVHTKIGQTRGTFIPSVCPITVRLHTASTQRASQGVNS